MDKQIFEDDENSKIKAFCENLSTLRKSINWTQEDLAQKLGVSRQTIVSIETGKTVPSKPLFLALIGLFKHLAVASPILTAVGAVVGIEKLVGFFFNKNSKK